MPEIVSRSVQYSYKNHKVLENLSFTVRSGEIVYLAGLNGSGKTTWIKLATQLLQQQSGEILFDCQPFSNIQQRASILFDTPPVYPKLSCYDNLFILYQVDCSSKSTTEFLVRLGLSEYLLKGKAENLSLGQRHRLGIAGALLRNPDFLILDEPDLGLDPDSWDLIHDLLLEKKANGCAILLTGQNFTKYEELADKIVILSNGSTLFEGSQNELIQKLPDSPVIDLRTGIDLLTKRGSK